jgi:hypothetical protein
MAIFWGCGEESTVNEPNSEKIETGISGSTYLNVEYGFRLNHLPIADSIAKTRQNRVGTTEDVLLMAFTTEDKFTVDTSQLMLDNIPFIEVSIYGPDPGLPSKPDVAKEIMEVWISTWEWLGIEVISRKPIAAVNTTGYEAILSVPAQDVTWRVKWAFFAKHDLGYIIAFWAPEDEYTNLIAQIEPMISSFELLGR